MPAPITDPNRPTCPVCHVPAYTAEFQHGRQRYRCPTCGATGYADTLTKNAYTHAARAQDTIDDEPVDTDRPFPSILHPATVTRTMLNCKQCHALSICYECLRTDLPVQCERTGRIALGIEQVMVEM